MFTGIIETVGKVETVETSNSNKFFWINSSVSHKLKMDESVSHNGVCLTVEEIKNNIHKVTAIEETLKKSSLGFCKAGDEINMERSLRINSRLNGHIVQGHVDTTAVCVEKKNANGSWEYSFQFPDQFTQLVIEKGSIALNGISLTVFNVTKNKFSVAIIPYTYEHTNMKYVTEKTIVNIEFDIIGKYVQKMIKK
ncbi:MAG: riboflavin synthase [Chitinophagaceae bacterium]